VFKKIAIIGLGLMGGSLAAACRRRFPGAYVAGISRNPKALALAKRKKWVHEATDRLLDGVRNADVIVLCTPVGSFLPSLRQIDRVCKKDALVMDVGSVKGEVLRQVNAGQWKNLSFVGCHPMVGSHERGIGAACPRLYDGGLILLTPDKKTCPRSFKQAKQFWNRFSGKIVSISPGVHDRFVGEISHLPHALAVCLMHAVSAPSLKFAATGFRHTTRIAASDSSIWQPIFLANKKEILGAIGRFEKVLRQFKKNLCCGNSRSLVRFLDEARRKRQAI